MSIASVNRDSSTQLSVILAFDGSDFDVDGELTFTVAVAAISGSSVDLSAGLAVTAVIEPGAAALAAAGTLNESDLDGAVVTLALSGAEFAETVSASQVSVSGLNGVSIASVNRDSSTQLSVILAFDGSDFDVDGELTFTVAVAAISGSSVDLSAGLAVTAVIEPGAAALAAAGTLNESDLDGAVVTLALSGAEFAETVSASQVSVSGVAGVSIASVNRDSSTQLSVILAFDGSDFDVDGELTFTVAVAAISGSSVDLSAGLAVTAVVELSAPPPPIAHWPTNNDANDAVGTSDGTLQGDAGFTGSAKVGSHALSLDGTADYVNLTSHASGFPLGDSARSFTGWFNADSATGQGLSFFAYGANGFGRRFSITADRTEASVGVGGHRLGVQNLSLSSGWHHIAVTYAAGGKSRSFSIYVDGVLQSSSTLGGSARAINTGSTAAYIGRNRSGTLYYEGNIDDVRLYDYQLSAEQVQYLFENAEA